MTGQRRPEAGEAEPGRDSPGPGAYEEVDVGAKGPAYTIRGRPRDNKDVEEVRMMMETKRFEGSINQREKRGATVG